MKRLLTLLFVLPWRALGWLRGALANLLLLAIIVLVATSLPGNKNTPTLPGKSVLYLEPGMAIVEQRSYTDPFSGMLSPQGEEPTESVLHEMTSAIRWARHDANITGIVIRADWLAGSDLGKLESIARAIADFRASGKPVIAIGDNFSQAQYFLASTADRIVLNPHGSVQVTGFGAYQSYMKDLLDQLAVSVHVFRAGQFKSFVEPFTRNDMSPEARENLSQWLDEQWAFYRQAIESRRKLAPGSLDRFVNEQDLLLTAHGNSAATLALEYGLVDQLATRNEAEALLNKTFGEDTDTIDTSTYYQHVLGRKQAGNLIAHTPRIAVIHASGPIMDGYQPPGYAGAETLIDQIRMAREDEDVAAIVLRIDSPGGSAFASELIREELAAAQAEGMPVVASMGGVAASGGYWIAATADEIWASPVTITGSIGVFGVIPTLENTLGKIGLHSDGYSTTALADALHLDRPMNPLAARVLQQGVDFTYSEFLRLVAAGRERSPEAIDRIAQGRVWTGSHAQQVGLVDRLGELDDAINAAAGLAKVEKYEPDYLEPALSPWEKLMQDFSTSSLLPAAARNAIATLVQLPAIRSLETLRTLNDPRHVYAQCWECRTPVR